MGGGQCTESPFGTSFSEPRTITVTRTALSTLLPTGQTPSSPKHPLKATGSATLHTFGISQMGTPGWTWLLRSAVQAEAGSSAGWSVWSEHRLDAPRRRAGPQSGHRQDPTSERRNEWNNKAMSLARSLPAPFFSLSQINFKKTVQFSLVGRSWSQACCTENEQLHAFP